MAPAVLKQSGMRVMIAEDSDSVRYALRLTLEYLGHEVVGQATNGEEAVTVFLQQHPQLVVMDVRMPVMDGLTSTTVIHRFDPLTKVLVVTAGRTTESQARAAGADAFVEKPFDISSLGRVIDHLATAA